MNLLTKRVDIVPLKAHDCWKARLAFKVDGVQTRMTLAEAAQADEPEGRVTAELSAKLLLRLVGKAVLP